MAFKDYYQVLGVEREASGEEIKKTYRQLAMAFHPDRNLGDPDSEERLKEINEAYQVLGDEVKRRRYDLICGQRYDSRMVFEGSLNGDLAEALRVFARGGFRMRGLGGCRGRCFSKRGWGRWREGS